MRRLTANSYTPAQSREGDILSFWDRLLEELRSLGELIVEWVILIAVALLILIIGRWILKWVRRIIVGIMDAGWLNPVWERSGVNRALEGTNQTAASITGTVVYAYLMVGLWLIVARVLNLTTIEDLLERLLAWIPILVLAAIVVIIAASAGSWTADLVRPFAAERNIPWLTWVTHLAVVVFGVVFALEILDIDIAGDLLRIVVAALGIALAVAFGVGGIDAAKLWWAKYGSPGSGKADRAEAPSSPPQA